MSIIFLQFFSFASGNYFTQTCSKLYSVMPWSVIFLLHFSNGINKWSYSTFLSMLNRGHVSFIIKQEGIHIFWSFCRFKDTTDAVREKLYQKPCAFTIIYYFILKNWLVLKWINSPSLSIILSKFSSVSQTSTVLGRLANDCWLCSKIDLQHIFCHCPQWWARMSCNSSN